MTYGADITEVFRQTVSTRVAFCPGRNQATCQFRQPTRFDLVINLKSAKALGITPPLTLQMTANDVIE